MTKNKKTNAKSRSTSFLRRELKGSVGFFIAGIAFSTAVTAADLINPKVISGVIDYILGSEPVPEYGIAAGIIGTFGGIEHIRANLWIPAVVVAAIGILAAVLRYLQNMLNSVGAERFVMRLRNDLFARVDRLSMPWYGRNSTGDILQRCTSDVETVKHFVADQMTAFVRTILLITLSIVFMVQIDGTLALIAGGFIPVIVGYSLIFHGKIGKTFMKADEQEGVVSSIVQENLTGIRVVRAFGKEAYECERFAEMNGRYTDLWIRIMRLLSLFWSLGDVISGLQLMTVTIVGAVFCVNGAFTAGSYIAFVAYNAMLWWPVRELGRIIADMSRAGVSIKRIKYIIDSEPEELGNEQADFGDADRPLIEFHDVSYSYNGSSDALKNISLRINKGEKIGIIGGTGSGKTTLTDLLMRMCGEEGLKGCITYRGKGITEYPLTALRKQFSRVLQEPFLFSGTIADNIKTAAGDITDGEMKEAADVSALTTAAEKFTDGFDTFVGERGVTLSGGQKQRCAIAAAIAKKDAEVLIFDDAFSALDAETESAVRKNLFERFGDKTVIMISHRISTIAGCDRIFVLDKGALAASGTHSELISKEGIYRDIYELQTGK